MSGGEGKGKGLPEFKSFKVICTIYLTGTQISSADHTETRTLPTQQKTKSEHSADGQMLEDV